MLAAEALRIAAAEALCPTESLAGQAAFPTMAGARVFDSRLVGIDDLDRDAKFTPVLAIFTASSTVEPRGEIGDHGDGVAECTLEIVAELAVASTDDDGAPFADAMAGDDWEARLTLAALCGQVRRILLHDERGFVFRRQLRRIVRWEEETFSIPQLGARWHRITMRVTAEVADDVFADDAGLPEPLRTLASRLPAGSPARQKLDLLAAQFSAVVRSPLDGIAVTDTASGAQALTDTSE